MSVVSEEIILTKDRAECLINELGKAIETGAYEIKIRIRRGEEIVIIPHIKPVNISIKSATG